MVSFSATVDQQNGPAFEVPEEMLERIAGMCTLLKTGRRTPNAR
jgi:hypothetical protein